jgi:SAM-dependent methyltransferase
MGTLPRRIELETARGNIRAINIMAKSETIEVSKSEVEQYYDDHVINKLRGFVYANPRVERAWSTVRHWAPNAPKRILEVGCGIGNIAWEMARYWPESEVVGLDISPKSIEIARKMFGSERLSFHLGLLVPGELTGPFDLIVLMDVYEHIPVVDRPAVHAALRELIEKDGRIILSVPTPRHNAWLKENDPIKIQPVDEDIDPGVILALAKDTETEVLLYQEVGVWHEGDYAHVVLGTRTGWTPARNGRGLKRRIREFLKPMRRRPTSTRAERLAIVNKALAPDRFPV